MRNRVAAMIAGVIALAVIAGCSTKSKLTESERTAPPPPGPRAGYVPPPPGATPGRAGGAQAPAAPPQTPQGR